jgi:phosphatidylglycerophosphate synthase
VASSRPSIPELRAIAQPPGLIARRSAEHWAGRLYMRRISLHATRWLVGTPATPNALTLLMIVAGVLAGVVLAFPGLLTAIAAALLVQVYLLLDCVDGEVARWRRVSSAAGVYLDRLGHHVCEAAIVVGLGFRAAGGPSTEASWWLVLGGVAALLVVLGKLESDLVVVARASAGLPHVAEGDPRSSIGSVRTLRRLFDLVPVHRLVGAIELTLAAVVAAVLDLVLGDLVASRVLLAAVGLTALAVAVGHPITIVSSQRLK